MGLFRAATGGLFGSLGNSKDKGSGRAELERELQDKKDAAILARSRKTLGLDPGAKIGGGEASQYQQKVSSKKKKKPKTVLSEIQAGDPEMKRKSMPGEENLTKKTLLGV